MLNKHTIKAAANANASRSQYKPVRCWLWVGVGGLDAGKDAYKSWFNDVLKSYLHMQRARTKLQQTTKKTRLTLFRMLQPIHAPPVSAPPLSKYLASAFWAVLNRWLDASERGVEEKTRRGSVASLEKLLAPVGSLDCLLGLWYEESRQAQLVPRWYCSCWICTRVCDVWAKQAIMIMPKFVRLQTTKSTISNAVPERRITYGSSFSGI